MKITLAGVDEGVSHVEGGALPGLREQLGQAFDQLAELTGKLKASKA